MKKKLILTSFLISLIACRQKVEDKKLLENRIDSLEHKLAESYKPGIGEFMLNIQVHHAKLWFAGKNKNWKLADFEIEEIKEAIEDIQKFQPDSKEAQLVLMLNPALDSVSHSIDHQNIDFFSGGYSFLTNTCNSCHHAADHEMNVIQIPQSPPFSNQDFSPAANNKF